MLNYKKRIAVLEKAGSKKDRMLEREKRVREEKDGIIAEMGAAARLDKTRISEMEDIISRIIGTAGDATPDEMLSIFLDRILANPRYMHDTTGYSMSEFEVFFSLTGKPILDGVEWLMRSNPDQYGKRGNRCKLSARHLLLTYLISLRCDLTQSRLGALLGVSQSSVCRYLGKLSGIVSPHLPSTGWRLKALLSGDPRKMNEAARDMGLITDTTVIEIERPSDPELRKLTYSGRLKIFCFKVLAITNLDGDPVDTAFPVPGSFGEMKALRIHLEGRGKDILKVMKRGSGKRRWTVLADAGFVGLDKELPFADVYVPHKRSKYHQLSRTETRDNRELAGMRIHVEHFFGRLKNNGILRGKFRGSAEDLDCVIRALTSLMEMRKMPRRPG